MCSEARGFRGWARKAARWAVLAAAVTLALAAMLSGGRGRQARGDTPSPQPPPPAADEPLAPSYSPAKAAAFLDSVALEWTRKHQCGTCHTNYAYLLSRSVLVARNEEAGQGSGSGRESRGARASAAMTAIRTFFEDRVAHWDDAEKAAKPRWDAEVVATAASLAVNDAATTGTLHPLTRKALDRIWTLQKADGSWSWLKCDWPPYEHDDYYGAVFAAVGVGSAPDGYARSESAQAGLERLRRYLRATPAPDLHHRVFLLWASTRLDGLMDSSSRDETIAALRRLQRPDGGWSLPSLGTWKRRDGSANDPNAPSDGYATGLAVYVLRQAGIAVDDPAVARGADWLRSHQRTSGRWFTRSVNNDKAHYISNAGTGFAVLALAACERP